jgi:hypothetical protein
MNTTGLRDSGIRPNEPNPACTQHSGTLWGSEELRRQKKGYIMYRRIVPLKSIGALLLLGFASVVSAQLKSSVQSITVTAQSSESISIALTTGGPVSITLPSALGQVSQGNVVPAWTTSWVLSSGRTAVSTYAYFVSANALIGLNPTNVRLLRRICG